jgi:hypothetical protein
MSGHLMNNGLALDAHGRDLLFKAMKSQRAFSAADCGWPEVSGRPKAAISRRLSAWFWRQCMPPHTGCVAGSEV